MWSPRDVYRSDEGIYYNLKQSVRWVWLGPARVWLSSFAWVRVDEDVTRALDSVGPV